VVTSASETSDLVVVGGGIVGLAVAREMLLRKPGSRVSVLEREAEVGFHQTGHNSGVIHAGIYYTPGSLKAQLCVSGSRLMYEFCDEHNIAYEHCGKVIVALDAAELGRLAELEARGHANGVEGLRRIGSDELREVEPHATGVAALHSPITGIIDYGAVARALADDLRQRGAEVRTNCPVTAIDRGNSHHMTVSHREGVTRARHGVVCAGAWSDRLAVAAGGPSDPRVVPFRGAYMRLRPQARSLVRGLIYPVPDPQLPFLGVHLTKRIDGEVLLGPTALMVGARDAYRLRKLRARDILETATWPGSWKLLRRFRSTVYDEMRMAMSRRTFVAACARYVPELTTKDVIRGPAGVRAQALGRDGTLVDDFVINELGPVEFVRNAPSPAATSALAIARHLVDRLEMKGEL
jgi:2-hydroxyglutarate dehydrogenase